MQKESYYFIECITSDSKVRWCCVRKAENPIEAWNGCLAKLREKELEEGFKWTIKNITKIE